MKLVTSQDKISRQQLSIFAKNMFGNLVKGVVDVEKEVMVIDAELHADEEAYLLEYGSAQENLWGINLYPELENDDWLEFDSMINVRPSQNNRSRGVDDLVLQKKIRVIIDRLVKK